MTYTWQMGMYILFMLVFAVFGSAIGLKMFTKNSWGVQVCCPTNPVPVTVSAAAVHAALLQYMMCKTTKHTVRCLVVLWHAVVLFNPARELYNETWTRLQQTRGCNLVHVRICAFDGHGHA